MPLIKALAFGLLNQNLRYLLALIILALRQLRELVTRCLVELNIYLYLALINSIASILRVKRVRSSYKK